MAFRDATDLGHPASRRTSPRFADRAEILASALRRAVVRSKSAMQGASAISASDDDEEEDEGMSSSPSQFAPSPVSNVNAASPGAVSHLPSPSASTSAKRTTAASKRHVHLNRTPVTARPSVPVLIGLYAPQFFGENLRFALVNGDCRSVGGSGAKDARGSLGLAESLSCRMLLDQCLSPEGNDGVLLDALAPLEDAAVIRALLKCRPLRLLRRSSGGPASTNGDVGAAGPFDSPHGSWELVDAAPPRQPQRWLAETDLLPLRPLGSHPRVVIPWCDGQSYEARCFVYLRSVNLTAAAATTTAASAAAVEKRWPMSWSGKHGQPLPEATARMEPEYLATNSHLPAAFSTRTLARQSAPSQSPLRRHEEETFAAAGEPTEGLLSPASPSAISPSFSSQFATPQGTRTGRLGRYTKWLAAIEERHGMTEWDRRAPVEDVVKVVRRLQQTESIDRLSQPKSPMSPPRQQASAAGHRTTPVVHSSPSSSLRASLVPNAANMPRREHQSSARGGGGAATVERAGPTARFALAGASPQPSALHRSQKATDSSHSLHLSSRHNSGDSPRRQRSSPWIVSPTQVNDAACDKVCDTFVSEPAMPHFCRHCGTSQEKHRAKKKQVQEQQQQQS